MTLKRLRKNVDRLESLGDSRLGAKVSRVIAKYAEVRTLTSLMTVPSGGSCFGECAVPFVLHDGGGGCAHGRCLSTLGVHEALLLMLCAGVNLFGVA